jgi:hypothetical protein
MTPEQILKEEQVGWEKYLVTKNGTYNDPHNAARSIVLQNLRFYPSAVEALDMIYIIGRAIRDEQERCAKIAERFERDPELRETGTCSQMIRAQENRKE